MSFGLLVHMDSMNLKKYVLLQKDNAPFNRGPYCLELVGGTFWRFSIDGAATTSTRLKSNRAFIGRVGEVHAGSCTYKYQEAVKSYRNVIAQHFSRGSTKTSICHGGGPLQY